MLANLRQWKNWNFKSHGRFGSKWHRLTENTVKDSPEEPGVYLLARPKRQGGTSAGPIGRLLADDPWGILDIGEAICLRTRIGQLRDCCANRGLQGHMAGWRLGTLRLIRRLDLDPDDLLVAWSKVGSKKEAYEWEGWLLRNYFRVFGELPPLNYKFNWSAFSDDELS